MKRISVTSYVLLCLLLFSLLFNTMVFAVNQTDDTTSSQTGGDKPIEIMLDNRPLTFDVAPIIKGGRTLVPFRAIGEALGATVGWDGQTQTVTLKRGETAVTLRIGDQQARINDRDVPLDVPALIVDGRTLVPVRFISESLGENIVWVPENRQVEITRNPEGVKPDPVAEPERDPAAGTLPGTGGAWLPLQQLTDNMGVVVTGLVRDAAIVRLRHADGTTVELFQLDQGYYETASKEITLKLFMDGGRWLAGLKGLQEMGWVDGGESWLQPVSIPEAKPIGSYVPVQQLVDSLGVAVTRLPEQHSIRLRHPDGTTLMFSRAERGLSAASNNTTLQMIIQDGNILVREYGLQKIGWLESPPAEPLPAGDWITLRELTENYGISVSSEGNTVLAQHPDGSTIVFSRTAGGYGAVHRGTSLNMIIHDGQTLADRSAFEAIGWLDSPRPEPQPAPPGDPDAIPGGDWIAVRQWSESTSLAVSVSLDGDTAILQVSDSPAIRLNRVGRVYEGVYQGTTLRIMMQNGSTVIDRNGLRELGWL